VRGLFSPAVPNVQSNAPTLLDDPVAARIALEIPDLNTTSGDKTFTMRNVYLNLQKEIRMQNQTLDHNIRGDLAKVQNETAAHLRAIRQSLVNMQYVITDMSRGGEYSIGPKGALQEIKAPRDGPSEGGCCSCLSGLFSFGK
jgi:hypothetical protein